MKIIQAAITDYHKYTCLQFKPAPKRQKSKIYFQDGDGCSSYVGHSGSRQAVTLASGCRYVSTVVFNLGGRDPNVVREAIVWGSRVCNKFI